MPPASEEMSSSRPTQLFPSLSSRSDWIRRTGIDYALCWIVVFRIEIRTETQTIAHIQGRLTESSIPELLRACRSAPQPVILDLTQLRSACNKAIQALRTLVADGARLRGAPRYIELLLNETPKGGDGA